MTLDDVVVVTVRKSFWASREAEQFPHRVYARVFYGHSTNLVNSIGTFFRGLRAIRRHRPRVVLLGSVERAVPWFIRAKGLGLLADAKLVVTNQLHLSDEQLGSVDANIVYSHAWIDLQRSAAQVRAVFVPLPADGDLEVAAAAGGDGGYVFAGGGTGRDFAALIEALRDTELSLKIVTFAPRTLGWDGPLPANVELEWLMPLDAFLERLAGARTVVVPLRDSTSDFGQTTLVQALALGKPVVTTRSPGVLDYVQDGQEGLLVEAGDVAGYRSAVLRLHGDEELRQNCARHARERGRRSSYPAFAETIADLCLRVGER